MKDLLTLTKQLIQIPSEPYNTQACQEILTYVKNELQEFPYREFHSNGSNSLLFSNKKGTKQYKIILNAHLDVVPATPELYQAVEKENKLYGRGANDMKASAAAMIYTFKELASKVTYPLGLQLVTDEEIGGADGTNYQIQQGVSAEFVLGGEHSTCKINNEAKGVILIKIKVSGKSSHSAQPWAGDNAAVKMGKIIHQLHKLFPIPAEEVWETTASVIKIETENNTVNTIPDNCSALVNIRYIPEEDRDIIGMLKKTFPEETTIEVIFQVPPEYTAKDNPFVQKLAHSITTITNRPIEYLKTHGQSDLRYYHSIKVPAVNFSPIGGSHHSINEWIDVPSLTDYQKVLHHFLLHI
jgi:succinyl-diaminopimelate desuccinylase